MSSPVKKALIKGTFILTLASVLTKLLGFYNRIFLANTIGAKEIGIYQLIFPVYLIVHCLSCQGFEMGIIKFVSEEASYGNKRNIWRYLKVCFICSFSLSILCMAVVHAKHDLIADYLLKQPACSNSLYILSFAFPILSAKDCILSYYYAMKKTMLPAVCQLLEQVVRVGSIYLIATYILWFSKNADLATVGLVAGEAFSFLVALFSVGHIKKEIDELTSTTALPISQKHPGLLLSRRKIVKNIFAYCSPLIGNRLLLTVLSSVEAVLIPVMLTALLGNEDNALRIYGIFTGMSLTFVFFPSAITNSVAMMLLPTVSEAKATSHNVRISKAASMSLHYCLLLGILCTTIFLAFGKNLGNLIFHEPLCGEFLFILAWLCPFIYVATCFTSILNGLGKTTLTFFNNCIAVMIRIFSIIALIPTMGIQGYLIGLLVSYGVLAGLNIYHVHKETRLHFSAKSSILSPVFLSFLGVTFAFITEFILCKGAFGVVSGITLASIVVSIGVLCLIYGAGCWVLRLVEY